MARDVTTYEVHYHMEGKRIQVYIGEDGPFAESIAKAVKTNNSIPVEILETHFKNGRRKEERTYTVNLPHQSEVKEIKKDCEIFLKKVTNPCYNPW